MRTILMAAGAALALSPIPALADPPRHAPAHGYRAHHGDSRYGYRVTRVWRGDDGRYRCRRDDGTTGLVIGAVAGGVVGHEVAGRGDRTLGTIIGAGLGALVGREIDRGDIECR